MRKVYIIAAISAIVLAVTLLVGCVADGARTEPPQSPALEQQVNLPQSESPEASQQPELSTPSDDTTADAESAVAEETSRDIENEPSIETQASPTETLDGESPPEPSEASAPPTTGKSEMPEKSDGVAQKPLSGFMIGIDAGHQGKGDSTKEPVSPGSSETKARVSSGTAGRFSKVPEHEVNLAVALLLEQKLLDLGADIVMVRRTADVNVSNSERAVMMNQAGTDLCIRIHCNGSDNADVNGALMMVPAADVTEDINEASLKAGEIILKKFIEATGARDTGILKSYDLTGFNWSTVPVCLIEMGYMTNEEEDWKLVDVEYQELCAQGLADGITEWAKSRAQ